jgi:hypothetical protein
VNIRNVAKFKSGSERVFMVVFEDQRAAGPMDASTWHETIMYLDEARREVIVECDNQYLNQNSTILTEDEKKPWASAIARAEKVIERLAAEHVYNAGMIGMI